MVSYNFIISDYNGESLPDMLSTKDFGAMSNDSYFAFFIKKAAPRTYEKLEFKDDVVLFKTEQGKLMSLNNIMPVYDFVDGVSEALSDRVLVIEKKVDKENGENYEHLKWFEKDAVCCNANGKPVVLNSEGEPCVLWNIHHNLVKDENGRKLVSLPIGDEINKWGVININPVSTLKLCPENNSDISVFLTKPEYNVVFKAGSQIIRAEDIAERYYDSIDRYAEFMNSEVWIEKSKASSIVHKSNQFNSYYIVNIACDESISNNKQISFTISEHSMETNSFNIGKRCHFKTIMSENPDGEKVTEEMKVVNLEKIINEATRTSQRIVDEPER